MQNLYVFLQLVSHGDVIMRAIYEFSASSYEEMSLDEGQVQLN